MSKIGHLLLSLGMVLALAFYCIAAEPEKTTPQQSPGQTSQTSQTSQTVQTGQPLQGPQRSSTIVGMSVKNPDGTNVGKIQELVIGEDGTVKYAILAHGGLLGIGDKLVPIPWKALKRSDDNKFLIVNITKDTLAKAPNFDPKDWPKFSEPDWQKKVEVYYELPSGQTAGR